MAYFARMDDGFAPSHRGKAIGRYEVPALPPVKPIDALRTEQIAAMQGASPRDPFTAREPEMPRHHGKARVEADTARGGAGSNTSSGVFGPPIAPKMPTRRIRVGVSDEELAALWRADDAKQRAADRMAGHADMMSKMDANRRAMDAGLPFERKPPPPAVPRKVHSDLPKPESNVAEVAGFAGLGAYCRPEVARHKATVDTTRPFSPPGLPGPKRAGVKVNRPPDGFRLGWGA